MSADKLKFNPYQAVNFALVIFLLIFMPLSRGGVHLWQQTVMAIVVQVGLILLLLEHKLKGLPHFYKTNLLWPIVAMLNLVLISTLFSRVKPIGFMSLYELFVYIGFYYLLIHSIRSRKHRLYILYTIAVVAALLSIIGFLQLADITFPWWRYADINQAGQMTASYGNRNHLAGYLEMALPVVVPLGIMHRNTGVKFISVSLFVLLICALILTLSRGGWSACFVSLLFYVAVLLKRKGLKRKKGMFLIILTAFVWISVAFLGSNIIERAVTLTQEDTLNNIGGRKVVWEGAVQMIKDHKFVGSGPGSFSTVFTQYQPGGTNTRLFYAHNDYVHYTAELGLPVLILMLWFLVKMFESGLKKLKSTSRQTRGIAMGAMTGVVAILVHSFVDFNLHIPANALLFITLAALLMERGGLERTKL